MYLLTGDFFSVFISNLGPPSKSSNSSQALRIDGSSGLISAVDNLSSEPADCLSVLAGNVLVDATTSVENSSSDWESSVTG